MRRASVLLRLLAVASACALLSSRALAQNEPEMFSPGTTPAEVERPAPPSAGSTEPSSTERDAWAEEGGEAEPSPTEMPDLRYFLEDVRIEGNARTHRSVIRAYVPLVRGDVIDADSEALENIAWGLRGTGFFDRVRLHLERGSRRGWVVLVVDVRERNTIVVQRFQPGVSEGLSRTNDPHRDIVPYIGFSVAETNVLGTGSSLEVAGLMSQLDQGVRVAYTNPRVLASRYSLRLSPFFYNAREFFGTPPVQVTGTCSPSTLPSCMDVSTATNAVVFYRRGGFAIGAGRAVGVFTSYSVDWQGEIIDVTYLPDIASQVVHGQTVPINFGIDPGRTFNSVLRLAVVHDRRDDPALTTRGLLLRVEGDIGTRLLGSRYDFARFQVLLRGWIPLEQRHVLRLSAYAGASVGNTPFFYQFHASDLSDLIPSRFLEMEVDRRAPPNFFNTSIDGTLLGNIATRFDVQYEYALYSTSARRPVRRVHLYTNVGVYTLADLTTASATRFTYHGFARIPLDLTFDAGVRIDTDIGLFDFGISNLVGFIPW